jgi:hypothetical protein
MRPVNITLYQHVRIQQFGVTLDKITGREVATFEK